MSIYTQYKSLYRQNNRTFAVNLVEWAELALTGQELEQFRSDYVEILAYYENLENTGQVTFTPITREITSSTGFNTNLVIGLISNYIGEKIDNEKYSYWENRFSSDPNVQYKPMISEG